MNSKLTGEGAAVAADDDDVKKNIDIFNFNPRKTGAGGGRNPPPLTENFIF